MGWRRVLVAAFAALALLPVAARADEGERKIGARVYAELEKEHKIVRGTAYDRALAPLAARLGPAATGLYDEPFRFYVVHDRSLNAFAVPGGYMFVHDALIDALGTKDELAGVMCHEMNHVIHHDGVALQRRATAMNIGLLAASVILRTPVGRTATDIGGYAAEFSLLHYSRHVETNADLGGADLCARAGYNPYGLVWALELLQEHAGHQPLEMLSNHPRDDHRITDLVAHFRSEPALFARFADDRPHAVPLYARRDDPAPLPYAGDFCPHGTNATLDAREASDWVARSAPWLPAPSASGGAPSERIAGDGITLGQTAQLRWFKPKDELGGTSLAFDERTHAAFVCEATPVATRIAVVGALRPPPFPTAATPLASAQTSAGIALLSPVGDVLKAYGPARPQPSDDGSELLRYGLRDASGAATDEWFRVKDGVVIAFGRDVIYVPERTQAGTQP